MTTTHSQIDQQEIVSRYLIAIDVNTMEFFEEMHDHIFTSFENRKDKSQDISTHIREVVQPAFGGVKGIHKILEERAKARKKLILKRFGSLFLNYLVGWPNVLITVLVIAGSIVFNRLIGTEILLYFSLACSLFLPILFFTFKQIQFRMRCKKAGKSYRTSEVYNIFSPFLILTFQIPNIALQLRNLNQNNNSLNNFFLNPWVSIPLSILMLLVFFTLSKLYKEQFVIKLTTNSTSLNQVFR